MSHAPKLSDEQIAEFKDSFSDLDKDGDGRITTEELGAAMRSLGLKPSDKELDFMVKQVDVDGNGTIDFNEFLVLMAQKIKDGEILQAFKVFDENGDGYISKQELASVMTKLGQRLSDKEVDQMMEAADTNEDGKINYIEFFEV
ncbi:hypothetical protein FRC15_004478 [Serendipita sp. 397]|nr:hypothetical protein FRC15_004478 [Serendipita sp. 397]